MDKFVYGLKVVATVIVTIGVLAVMGIVSYTIGWQHGYDAYEEQLKYEQRLYEELPDKMNYYREWQWEAAE